MAVLKAFPAINPPGAGLRKDPRILRHGDRLDARYEDTGAKRVEPDPRGSRRQRRAAARRRRGNPVNQPATGDGDARP